MSNSNSNSSSNNGFSHAFLPGLILGLIIGGVAGAFLPDFLGGPKFPANRGAVSGSAANHSERGEDRENGNDAEAQQAIDEAMNQMQNDAEDAVEELETEAGDGTLLTEPVIPPSDG